MSISGGPVRPPYRGTKGDNNEGFGGGQGEQGIGSRADAHRSDLAGNGKVQRGTREGWRNAGRRGTAPEFERQAREILRRQSDCDRWAVCRDEGAHCGVLAVEGQEYG